MAIVPDFEVPFPEYLRILFHGFSDSGKTVLASCADDFNPSEPLIIDDVLYFDIDKKMESQLTRGAGIIVKNRWPVSNVSDWRKGMEFLDKHQGDFRYVVIDTFDRLQDIVRDDLTFNPEHGGTVGKMDQNKWWQLREKLERTCNDMSNWKSHVIVTAHTEQREDPPDSESYRLHPSLIGGIKSSLPEYFHMTGFYTKFQDGYTGEIFNDEGDKIRRLFLEGNSGFYATSCIEGLFGTYIDGPTIPGIIDAYEERRNNLIATLETATNPPEEEK